MLLSTAPDPSFDPIGKLAIRLMSEGGDTRIALDPTTGLNRYHSAPYPRDLITFASSTANDMSKPAFDHVLRYLARIAPGEELNPDDYAVELEKLRRRIRATLKIGNEIEIVFAPSGTDLEYVALAAVRKRSSVAVHNILLGADEVGCGCIQSAHGQFFASKTARGVQTNIGEPVPGLDEVTLKEIRIRDAEGRPKLSSDVAGEIEAAVNAALAAGAAPVVHVVHGSKTGLILPSLETVDELRTRYGEAVLFIVDACQGRISQAAIGEYLDRGLIVFLTGSKFMGGPPFSGIALIPRVVMEEAEPLPEGLSAIFRRAEWPEGWPGGTALPAEANLGLLLRLEAAIFELERFAALDHAEVRRIVQAFDTIVRRNLIDRLAASCTTVIQATGLRTELLHPIEMRTLSTIDISDFETAVRLHKELTLSGIRLGQPVRCVPRSDGQWGGTLRVGLSMPQVVTFAALRANSFEMRLTAELDYVANAIDRLLRTLH